MTDNEPLLQASRDVVDAILAGDLSVAARLLDARAQAIAQGAAPSPEIIALGEHAAALLGDLRRQWAQGSARLDYLHRAMAQPRQSHLDVTF
jgi:hypothetical protein